MPVLQRAAKKNGGIKKKIRREKTIKEKIEKKINIIKTQRKKKKG
jgi:hypothetical protein